MPFVRRAKTYYASDEIIKAVVTLIEGLKRFPENTEAFRWLLDLYCEEVPHTGLEEDLVTIVDGCPDPEGVYAYVFDRLTRAGRHKFVKRLDRARREAARRNGTEVEGWSALVERVASTRRQEREIPVRIPVEPAWAPPAELVAAQVAAPMAVMAMAPAGAAATAFARPPMQAGGGAAWMGGASVPGLPPMSAPPLAAMPRDPAPPPAARSWPHTSSWTDPNTDDLWGEEEELPNPDIPVPDAFLPLGALDDTEAMIEESASGTTSRDSHLLAHPLLLARQNSRLGVREVSADVPAPVEPVWARRRSPIAHRAPVMPRPSPRVDLTDGPDEDAVRRTAQPASVRRPRETVWRTQDGSPRRGSRKTAPRRRLLWLALGVLVLSILVGILVYVGVGMVGEGAAADAAGAENVRLDVSALALDEASLLTALEQAPESPDVVARLRWTRSLNGYLARRAPDLEGLQPTHEPRLEGWVVAASVLDALGAGQVGEANAALPELRRASAATTGFPVGLASWIEGEVALAGGDLTRAQLAHEKAAADGFTPGALSAAEVCLRRGDTPCARKNLAALRNAAPEHPGLALGAAVLPRLEAALAGVSDVPAPGLTDAARRSAASDRRLMHWVTWVDGQDAVKALGQSTNHPMMRLLAVEQLLNAGQLDAAAQLVEAFDARDASPALLEMRSRLVVGGFTTAGRPDIALRFLPGPPESDLELRDWVNRNAELALNIAALHVELGQAEDARRLLALLLADPVREPSARILALELHLEEGRVEDVRRHIDRLAQHRGALLGAAALDVYQGRTSSALAILGASSPGALPSPTREPHLYRFELRTRLLALAEAGRIVEARELVAQTHPSPALLVRIGLAGPEVIESASERGWTGIDDQVDLAVALLARKDFEGASMWATRAVDVMPTHTEAHRVLAYTSVALGKPAASSGHAQIAMKGRPEDVDLQLMAPEAEVAHGDPARAIDMVRAFLAGHPTDARALHLLGEAYYRARHLSRGAEDFQQRLRAVDERVDRLAAGEVHFWLGRLMKSALGNAEGGSHLRKARELLGDRADVLVALGDYYRMRDSNHALELYQSASGSEGAPAGAHLALGRFAANRGYREIAVGALERYIGESDDKETRQWASKKLTELR